MPMPLKMRRMQDAVRSLPRTDPSDFNPQNLHLVDQEMRRPDAQSQEQQAILAQERKRLEAMQGQRMQQAAMQQFQQRLQQRMNPRIGTQEDTDPQALKMFQLMQQMKMVKGQSW